MNSRRTFLKGVSAGAFGLGASRAWSVPTPTSAGALRFAFYTDVHARVEWDTPKAMALAAETINQRKPDLVITGGDMITDGFQSSAATVAPRWQAYLDNLHHAVKPELRPAIGNHDLVAAMPEDGTTPALNPREAFLETMKLDNTWYAFDAQGYHFIVLDSVEIVGGDLKYRGFIDEEQTEWIRQDLAGIPADRPIVLVSHMPLLTSFYAVTHGHEKPPPANRVIVNNKAVLRLFEKHNLILVLQGHLHVNEFIRWRNTTFITGGAVCAKWWRGPWFGTEEGFGEITIKDGRVHWDYVDLGWEARRPAGK